MAVCPHISINAMEESMTEIISVRFKPGGKVYDFDPRDLKVTPGTGVIVETSRGEEYGECVRGNATVEDARVTQPLRPVVRIADRRDRETAERNREKEAEAFSFCRERIEALGLEMKLVKVEYSFDGSKVVCFFTAENRVDFRQLVRELASRLHARIELRQIGVRDEAKMLGGLGICGKPFCCSQFLEEFHPVSIKMAKTQNISLNPTKISGTCGRLMCCLKYEQEAYEDAVKRCPREESFVECPEGVGTVSGVNLLRETAKVQLEDSTEAPKTFHISELRVVRSGKGKRPEGYVAPARKELEKLRKVTPRAEENTLSRQLDTLLGETKRPSGEVRRGRQPREEKQSGGRVSANGKSSPGTQAAPEEKKQRNDRRRRFHRKGKGKSE